MRANEFIPEVEETRYRICEYVAGRKNVVSTECAKEFNLPISTIQHYMQWLAQNGFLTKRKVTIHGRRQYIYNVDVPYVKREQYTKQVVEETPSHIRVIRLTDKPYINPEPNKRISRRGSVAIGSSINLFGSW